MLAFAIPFIEVISDAAGIVELIPRSVKTEPAMKSLPESVVITIDVIAAVSRLRAENTQRIEAEAVEQKPAKK